MDDVVLASEVLATVEVELASEVLASEVLTTVELVVNADDDVVSGNAVLVVTVVDEVVLAPVDDVVMIGSLLGLFEGDRLGAFVGLMK